MEKEKSGSLDSVPASVYDSVCLGDYFGDYSSSAPTPNSETPSPASVNPNLKSQSSTSNNNNSHSNNTNNESAGNQGPTTTSKTSHSANASGVQGLDGKYRTNYRLLVLDSFVLDGPSKNRHINSVCIPICVSSSPVM